MIEYEFFLYLPNSTEKFSYALELTDAQENQPERIFTPENRKNIQNYLQRQSGCKISDSHLNRIVEHWLEDIKEGYRESRLTLDLPLLIADRVQNIRESGNQALPKIIPIDLAQISPQSGALPPLNFA